MKINNYVWENDLSLNDLVLKQKEKIDELESQLQQKENIIKEVRELAERRKERIEELSWVEMKADDYIEEQDELLEILGSDKE